MDSAQQDLQQHVFRLLQEVVSDLSGTGRLTYAAAVKPQLQHRTSASFSESRLGFRSFRDFLLEAQRQGFVDLREAPGGDLEILVAGVSRDSTVATGRRPVPSGRRRHDRVRSDFWRAFVDWGDGLKRLYDRSTGRVVMFAGEAPPPELELPDAREARAAWSNSPERFVEIKPVPFIDQLAWMREFADSLDDAAMKTALQRALESERPARAFAQIVRGVPQLADAWFTQLFRKVADTIQSWGEQNSLEVEFLEPVPRRSLGPPRIAGPAVGPVSEAKVRERLHAAIERMPLADLLRISLPVEYLIEH